MSAALNATVPEGYKLTEVGVIPGDWEVKKLGDFVTLQRGHDLTWRERRLGNIPIMGSAGQNGFHDTALAQGPGVIIGRSGASFGQAHYCASDYWPHNTALYVTDFQESDRLFVYYFFKYFDFTRHNSGGAQQSLNRNFVYPIPIAVPQRQEQRAIATALSDVDALLAKLGQLIAKKQNLKQAAMQQLLTGQTRLPGFSGEWEVKTMKSLGQTYGGLTGKTKVDFGHGSSRYIPFMNVMTDTVIDPEWLEYVNISTTEAQNLTKKGDLFFNGSSETPEEVGFCAVLLEDISSLYLNSFCFGFRFNSDAKVHGLFFAYWFRSTDGRAAMSVLAQGATRYNIAKSAFLRLSIPQPSLSEQTAIATVLSDLDAELAALQVRHDKTRALKQGMMQALLTGRIRLL